MTEAEYILEHVTEQRLAAEQALCYGPLSSEAETHTLRGIAKALLAVETFVKDYQNQNVEE